MSSRIKNTACPGIGGRRPAGLLQYGFASLLIAGMLVALLSACSRDAGDLPAPGAGQTGEIQWAKTFGGSGAETARSIIATRDGGLAILGFSESTDGDLSDKATAVNDYWLLKLDAAGNREWTRTYGGSKDDRGQAVVELSDGGYAITGYAMSDDGDGSNNEGFHDNWVLRLDAAGEILWERSFGFSGHDHSYDLLETDDGGLFFIGFLDLTAARADGYAEKNPYATRHGVGEFWCTKLSADGSLQWRYYFGGTDNDRAHAAVAAPDGGFVMAGFSESDDFDISQPNGSYDFWVVKVNRQGELQWETNLGGTGIDIASDIAADPRGGYLVAGQSFSTDGDISANRGESDVWVVRLDPAGNMLWEQSYGGTAFDAAESIALTSDGNFLISGTTRSSNANLQNAGENDVLLLKIDGAGRLLWQTTYGGPGIDLGFDAVEAADGSIYVAGELSPDGSPGLAPLGETDLLLLKIR